jgi:hypothetical protein
MHTRLLLLVLPLLLLLPARRANQAYEMKLIPN